MPTPVKAGIVLLAASLFAVAGASPGPFTVVAGHAAMAPDPNPLPAIGGLREQFWAGQDGRPDTYSATRGDVKAVASSALAARMIQSEAEYLYRRTALRWLGHEPKAGWMPVYVWHSRAETHLPRASISTNRERVVTGTEIAIVGDLEPALERQLPREMTRLILARHFHDALGDRPRPYWVTLGAPVIDTLDHQEQVHQFDRCQEYLANGQVLRLSELASRRAGEADRNLVLAQGYSLTRFLVTRAGRRSVVRLLELGVSGGDWDKAVSGVYGFKSLDALEEAWVAWMKKPDSRPVPKK